MKATTAFQGLGATLLLCSFLSSSLFAAAPCKGPNKNDPGCPGAEEPPPPPEPDLSGDLVDSVTVDWLNERLVVRGTTLDTVTAWALGGAAGPLATANVSATQLDILFDASLAGEVQGAGSYVLSADGVGQLTVYIEAQVVDPAATGCPCQATWSAQVPGWGLPDSDCLEIEGPGANDPADISGTVLSVPGDPTAYPQYPIGASFYPGEPDDSVCRLVQVNADLSTAELVKLRINENQQSDCRAALAANVCASITTLP